jgi:hypothetical protein
MGGAGRFRRAWVLLASLGLIVVMSGPPGGAIAKAPSGTPGFGREVIVDHQRVAGEPSIAIDGSDTIYVSAPFGFSTTASFVWRSIDHGQSFHLVPGNTPPLGKPAVTCVGGGDTALALDTANRLYFTDLQGLTDVSNSVSSNQGATWQSTCNAANATGVDRPWIADFGDPQNGGAFYQTVDQIGQCIGACSSDLGQVGSNIVEITRSQNGVTFSPLPAQQIEPDAIVSGIVTDPHDGSVYIAHTGLVEANGTLGGTDKFGNSNAVIVDYFPGGYQAATTTTVPVGGSLCQVSPTTCKTEFAFQTGLNSDGTSPVTVGQDFAPIAIDDQGNLYVTWSQANVDSSTGLDSGSSQIYLAVSTNHGASWSKPIDVTAATPTLQTNVFPWIAAGDPGRLDIVWYGTPTLGDPNLINATWQVEMAQTLNAVTNGQPNPAPSFTTTQVSELSPHVGSICTTGIGCTNADRGLLDFLSVTPGLKGEANIVWADSNNQNKEGSTSAALIAFNRQVSGPSLFASVGTVSGTAPATGSATGSPDAGYYANGTVTPASPNLLLKSASITQPDAKHFQVQITVNDLSTTLVPATLGGADAVWMVRWEAPGVLTSTGAGHIYFAAMESDGGGQPSFYDGTTSAISTSHAKFLTYPPAHTIQGSVTQTSNGWVITLLVPIADVGGSAPELFSLTGLSATEATSSSTNPIFNQIDATAPFDFTPKH